MNTTLKSVVVVVVGVLIIAGILKMYDGKNTFANNSSSDTGGKVTGIILGEGDNGDAASDGSDHSLSTEEGVMPKGEYKTVADMNEFYDISAEIPTEPWDKGGVMASYVNSVVDKAKSDWKIGGEAYKTEMQITKDFTDRTPMKYELNVDYEKYASKKLGTVTYVLTAYEFTGGAHGSAEVNAFTFNQYGQVPIDNVLSLADNNNDIELSRAMLAKLPAILGDYADKQMMEDGLGISYLKSDGVTLDKQKCNCDGFFFGSNFQKFVILDSGIKFIMGQYQVAPYVAGMPEVKFSWAELAKYLKISISDTSTADNSVLNKVNEIIKQI